LRHSATTNHSLPFRPRSVVSVDTEQILHRRAMLLDAPLSPGRLTAVVPLTRRTARASLPVPATFLDPDSRDAVAALGSDVAGGAIYEILSCEQFDTAFDGAIAAAGGTGPRAFCGAVASAAAVRLAMHLATRSGGGDLVGAIAAAVRDIRDHFLADVELGLREIRGARLALLEKHPDWFATPKEKAHFLNNWIANYEVSDFVADLRDGRSRVAEMEPVARPLPPLRAQLAALCGSSEGDENAVAAADEAGALHKRNATTTPAAAVWERLVFARANQMPELAVATPDEHERLLAEEITFSRSVASGRGSGGGGGESARCDTESAAAVTTAAATSASDAAPFARGEASCFVEVFSKHRAPGDPPRQQFLRLAPGSAADATPPPSATTATIRVAAHSSTPLLELPCAAVLDLQGHFVAAVFCRDGDLNGGVGDAPDAVSVVVVNSMRGSIAEQPPLAGYVDLVAALVSTPTR
jgi:hypothetical protein